MKIKAELKSFITKFSWDIKYYFVCNTTFHEFNETFTIIEKGEKKLFCSRCKRTVLLQDVMDIVSGSKTFYGK